MRSRRLLLVLSFVCLFSAQSALGFHVPPWDTGHQSFEPDPGDTNTDCGDDGPCKTGSPVEVASGNFIHSVRLLSVPGTGPAVDFVLTYNSHDRRRGPLGQGWVHPYDIRVVEVSDGTNVTAITTLGNGKRERFTKNADSSYKSPPHDTDRLVRQSDGTLTLRDKHGLVRRFSSAGLLLSIVDRNDNSTSFTYDNSGFLTAITDAAGRRTTFSKNASGRIASMTDPASRVFTLSYDNSGFLARITTPAQESYQFKYDPAGNLLEILDPRNNKQVDVTYDKQGRVSTLVEGQETWSYAYFPENRRTTKRDSANNTWTYEYTTTGNITRITDPFKNDQQYTFDAALNVTKYTDELGRVTTYTSDAQRNRTSERDALGNTIAMTYEPAFGLAASVRSARGDLTRAAYDARGNLTSITTPAGDVTSFTYSPKGLLTKVTDALGKSWSFEHDAYGNIARVTDPLGRATNLTFDVLGRITSVADPESRTTRFTYDNASRIIQVTDPLNGVTRTEYDASGNVTSVTSAKNGKTSFEYDAFNRMTRMTNATGQATTYTYDARSRLATKRDPKGNTNRYSYDALDRLTQVITATDTFRYTYDAVGNMLTATDADSSVTFAYDVVDRIVRASTGASTGRPATTIQYTYDADGNRLSMIDPTGGTTTYSYDSLSRLTSITDPAGSAFTFSYNALSRRTSVARPAGLSTTYSYDDAGQLVNLMHQGGPGALPHTYTYNRAGQRLTMADNAGTHTYTYDLLDRLTAATHPSSNPAEAYSYDPVGNRLTSQLSATHTYDAANRFTADAKYDYVYDANGNLTERNERGTANRTRYSYDADDRLTQIVFEDSAAAQYRYDALGRRTAKVVRGAATEFVYDGLAVLAEYTNSVVSARYTNGPIIDELLSVRRGNTTGYFQTDVLGTVKRIVDSSTTLNSYTYDSFGRTISEVGGRLSPFRFQGRELDDESSFYYFRARYYSPNAGRFITEDPIGLIGGVNFYAFVENNPINILDPNGLCPCGKPSDVVKAARSDKSDWSMGANRTDLNSGFGSGTYKCNLFADKQYEDAGYHLPNIGGSALSRLLERYPPGAGSLSDRGYDVPGWPVISSSPRPGDLIAEHGHVGIVTGRRSSISASPGGKVENDWGFRDGQSPVIRRCTCK